MSPLFISSRGIVYKNTHLNRISKLIDDMECKIHSEISINNDLLTSEISERILEELTNKFAL
ncbi:hypothetical protein UFOVP1290_363 [uncultured Caudovirales phage]|uniref:Uncharacterized protein n=1 Tax=uncultured Caudovirales phage TaxID=2100421 RepID=A0A6J5RHI3_9CAUD|nr:hypothetical protein UFOVP1290_363 [uncultured Caudovirales phage]